MNSNIHIISASVPWPPHDSRTIDILEQLKMLREQGIRIHLHYYCNDLHCHPTELNRYCETVHPYGCKPESILDGSCDVNQQMLDVISRDNHPVIFEGLHCTALLQQLCEAGRKVFVRMFDDECRNAAHLAKETGDFLNKIKLKNRSAEIKKRENELPSEAVYIFSNQKNAEMFREDHSLPSVTRVDLFHPFNEITSETGVGNFFLYHGDLSDPYNEKAAVWLLEKVFNDIRINFVIAGKNPGKRLNKLGHLYQHTCLIADPSDAEMEDLIHKAQGHVLPSFSYKRPELKLIHALYGGRHCIVNENAVRNTRLEPACYVANTANAFKAAVFELNHKPFEENEIRLKEKIFEVERKEEDREKFFELVLPGN